MHSLRKHATDEIMSEASVPMVGKEVPLVSIVVPNFNHRRFLPERFNSVFTQTYRNVEICFLDDASDDGSVEYVRGLASPFQISIDVNKQNSGSPFRQWARGLSLTRGEFVWIAEADDSCDPDFLERMVALAKRNPSAGFVYSQSRIINERGQMLEETPRYLCEIHPSRWRQDYFARGAEEVSNYLILRNTVPNASACLFRREALLEIDLAEMPLRLCGDWLAYAQILRRHDIAYLAAPLNSHRQHEKTLRASSDRGEQRIRESYRVQESIAEKFKIAPEIHELACRFTFQEWKHLQRTAVVPSDIRLSSPELLQAARSFDPAIDQRFDNPGAQALPSLLVQQRSWRTAWRWRSQWQAYRDDQSVRLRMGPYRGEVRLDPLAKTGTAMIERLSFFETNSRDLVADLSGSDLGCCLRASSRDIAWHIDAKGFQVRRNEEPASLRVIPPAGLQGRPYEFEIVLRAEPPLFAGFSQAI
jgi:glycosyltransferase involved in cell wall biosynthesis